VLVQVEGKDGSESIVGEPLTHLCYHDVADGDRELVDVVFVLNKGILFLSDLLGGDIQGNHLPPIPLLEPEARSDTLDSTLLELRTNTFF